MSEHPEFLVDQEHFSGTLGELAYALRRGDVPPTRIDLYALVRSYLTYFEERAGADLEAATEALPRVAQVIELKVRLLLPRPPLLDGEEEEQLTEEALSAVALLEELEEAIHFLRRRREERRLLMPARAPRPTYPRRERPQRATPRELARLAGRYPIAGYFEFAAPRLTVASAARSLLERLRRVGRGTLEQLIGARNWSARTVGLAALLELVKEGRVMAAQREPFGEIEVRTKPVSGASEADARGGAEEAPAA